MYRPAWRMIQTGGRSTLSPLIALRISGSLEIPVDSYKPERNKSQHGKQHKCSQRECGTLTTKEAHLACLFARDGCSRPDITVTTGQWTSLPSGYRYLQIQNVVLFKLHSIKPDDCFPFLGLDSPSEPCSTVRATGHAQVLKEVCQKSSVLNNGTVNNIKMKGKLQSYRWLLL